MFAVRGVPIHAPSVTTTRGCENRGPTLATVPGPYRWRRCTTCGVALLVVACSETPPTAPGITNSQVSFTEIPTVGSSVRGYQPVSAAEREAARTLARAIAAALRDRPAVDYVKAALAGSAAPEQKLHFASFLSGRGGLLVSGMLRNGAITMEQLTAAVRGVRDLEFYMPVGAHRDRWTGAEAPLVAIALREEETPEAYDGHGNRQILNRVFPPAHPVLVLAPVETNLRAQIALNSLGRAEYPCAPRTNETLTEAAARCSAASPDRLRPLDNHVPPEITGLYVTAIELYGDQCGGECWAWGNPEYQIITFAKTSTAETQMRVIQCSGDDAVPDYRWNMDGRTWAGMGRLLNRSQMDITLHVDSGWMHQFWEDDQDNCNLVPHVDPWAEALAVINGVHEAWTAWDEGDVAGFIHGVQAAANGIQGLIMGGDDLIGNIVNEEESQFGDGEGSTHNMVIQRGTNGSVLVGRATIKPYTASGPYIGPVVNVRISHPSGTMFPLGSGIQLSAYGVDMFGTHVPDRPVSWSSSNPSVASVDAYGFVTGHQEGSATITATIDGVSASIAVYPKPPGAPVATRTDQEFVNLQPGQWTYVYARLYDSNGWEVPTAGNYEWSSSDPSACQVGYGSVDGEAYLVGNGGIGATITVTSSEGLTDTLYCSVGGGDALIPVRPIGIDMKAGQPSGARTTRTKTPASGHRR
jgi:Big-like domain-containing protein